MVKITDSISKAELRDMINEAVASALAAKEVRLLTTAQVISSYGLSRTSLWRLTKNGTLHATKGKGRQLLYSSDECQNVLTK